MKPEDIDKEVTTRVPVFIGKDSRYFNNRYQIVQKKKKMVLELLLFKTYKRIVFSLFVLWDMECIK